MSTKTAAATAAAVVAVAVVGVTAALVIGDEPTATVDDVPEAGSTPSPASSSPEAPDDVEVEALKAAALPTPAPTPSETETADPEEAAEEPEPSYPVADVQRQLKEMGYYRGPVDGEEGPATATSVMAFQKVQGIGVDGVVGPATLKALEDPRQPDIRSGPSTRIEVDLSRQVAYWIEGGEVSQIFPVSSGSGEAYTTQSGSTAYSLTPVGWYQIERRISGIRDAPLGILYNPMYFYRGWALHGSNSVPAYPASHGCVRMPRADARWLFDRAPDGTHVHLYGGEHTFQAGSAAPGTDTPAGDTGQDEEENEGPTAEDDSATVRAGESTDIRVLANDSDDSSLGQAELSITTRPQFGTVEVRQRRIRFTAPDRADSYLFGYRVCDEQGACDRAMVTVTVREPSPTPTWPGDGSPQPTASDSPSPSGSTSPAATQNG